MFGHQAKCGLNPPSYRTVTKLCSKTRRNKRWMKWKLHPNYGCNHYTWIKNVKILKNKKGKFGLTPSSQCVVPLLSSPPYFPATCFLASLTLNKVSKCAHDELLPCYALPTLRSICHVSWFSSIDTIENLKKTFCFPNVKKFSQMDVHNATASFFYTTMISIEMFWFPLNSYNTLPLSLHDLLCATLWWV